jgi:hypothetical protein
MTHEEFDTDKHRWSVMAIIFLDGDIEKEIVKFDDGSFLSSSEYNVWEKATQKEIEAFEKQEKQKKQE